MRRVCGEPYPEVAGGVRPEHGSGEAEGARGAGGDRNEETGHRGGRDEDSFAWAPFAADGGRILTPGPVGGADQALHKAAENGGYVVVIYWRCENDSIRGFNLLKNSVQVVVLHAFPPGLAGFQCALAAIAAELDMLLGEVDDVRFRTVLTRRLQNLVHSGVNGGSAAVAA